MLHKEQLSEKELNCLKTRKYSTNYIEAEDVIYWLDSFAYYTSAKKRAAIRRKARMAFAKIKGTHTSDQWECILKIFDYKCACCGSVVIGGRPTKDHIIPISSGGSDGLWNLQPLCRECNSSNISNIDYRPRWLIDLVGESE